MYRRTDVFNGINGQAKPLKLFPMTTDEQLRTLFIKGLPVGMPNNQVQGSLELIPGFEALFRVNQVNGLPGTMAFVRYSTGQSVKVGLEVLPKVKYKLKGDGNDETEVELVAVAEENTHRWLAAKFTTVTVQSVTRMPPDNLARQISNVFSSWKKAATTQSENLASNGAVSVAEPDQDAEVMSIINASLTDFAELAAEFPGADLTAVREDIKEFRQRSLRLEQGRIAAGEEFEKQRHLRIQATSAQALQSSTPARGDSYENRNYEFSDEEQYGSDDDETIERKLEEKRIQKLEWQFQQQEKRWLNRERARAEALERERIKDQSRESRVEDARMRDLAKYAEFRDDDEGIRSTMEYYYDHARWVKSRMYVRERELAADKADEQDEARELSENGRGATESLTSNLSSAGVGKKISLSLSGVAKKQQSQPQPQPPSEQLWRVEEEEEEKKPLRPLSLPKPHPELPKDSDKLFKWPIKWDKLDETILEDVVRPFVTSNIIEFLGIQEDDLINFIVQHVKNHKPAEDLLGELEITLDEDAKLFTDRLWRVIIEETE